MGNSLEQYRAAVGTHDIFVSSRNYKMCMKGKFWNTLLFLFYLEAIYLQTLKVVVHNYNLMRFNRLWLTQIYLYQFYIPDLILLANDVEVNPGRTLRIQLQLILFYFMGLGIVLVRRFGVQIWNCHSWSSIKMTIKLPNL